jgi:Ca-activated chloride channel family protein
VIEAFHFLRPWWLLLVPAGLGLVWLWRQRTDVRTRWGAMVAPHLLAALTVGGSDGSRLRPVHLVAAGLVLAGIAASGPTWEREAPPFGREQAPMVVAIDLSATMAATDVGPTRLERVKQKVRDLLALRPGARTGLVVYAGTAHLVLPPAEDPALLQLFLDALATDLMPVVGRNAAAALAEADALLAKEQAPGTILFFTDGFEAAQIPAFAEHAKASPHGVLVLGVGTARGGPVRTKDGGVATDASGRPIRAGFDAATLRRLSSEAGVPVASVTLDDDDVAWVQRRAQRRLDVARTEKAELRWKEAGYWLTVPIALLGALWFRKGWVVRWAAAVLVAVLCGPVPSHAGVVDFFLTPDQQGRWYFERGDWASAAARFQDPMWKGLALYRAQQWGDALGEFARLDTPEAFFLMGNCQARLGAWAQAVAAYDNALRGRAEFPEATANRALAAALLAKQKEDDEEASDPNLAPDDVRFDERGKRGRVGQVDAPLPKQQEAELWMRNLKTSPADFLRQKFLVQVEEASNGPQDTP